MQEDPKPKDQDSMPSSLAMEKSTKIIASGENTDSLMQIAQKSYAGKNYAAAVNTMEYLLKLCPTNTEAVILKRKSEDAIEQIKIAAQNKATEQAEQKRQLNAAESAFNSGDIQTALKLHLKIKYGSQTTQYLQGLR